MPEVHNITKHEFKPSIIIDADTVEAARRELFKLLTHAVTSERIFYFTLPEEPKQDD